MINEKSCGAVVFTKDSGCIKYVIIESKSGLYGFPKGHVEGNETEHETALREVLEETGLRVEIVGDFREESRYVFHRRGKAVSKTAVYYLAEYSDQTPVAQESELDSIALMTYDEAQARLKFDDMKRILSGAHSYLAQFP